LAITKTKNNSFGKEHRLRGRSAFLGVMFGRDSRHMKGRWCEMILGRSATKESDKPGTKFGISVSRKAGGAVRRNRLKRIIREYLRTHKALWPEGSGNAGHVSIVIRIVRPITDEADLIAEIEDMLKSVNK
jgi:ribonuclease P protein component